MPTMLDLKNYAKSLIMDADDETKQNIYREVRSAMDAVQDGADEAHTVQDTLELITLYTAAV
jgi:cellobiose-specific phosphotransferase system component IIA